MIVAPAVDGKFSKLSIIIDILKGKALSSTLGQIVLWTLATAFFIGKDIDAINIVYMSGILALNAVRLFVILRRHSISDGRWYTIYKFSTVGTAAGWSLLGCDLLSRSGIQSEVTVMILIFVAGIMAAATAALSPAKRLAKAFLATSAVPLMFTSVFLTATPHYFLAAVLVTYLVFLFKQVGLHSDTVLKLRERDVQVRSLSDASFDAIVIHRGGKILEVNPAFDEIFKTQSDAVTHQELASFFSTGGAPWPANLETGRLRVDGLCSSGQRIPLEIASRTIVYQGGRATVSFIQDISARVTAEQIQLESARQKEALVLERETVALEALQLKNDFIATVSHELRTPLNAIIGITDLLETTGDEKVRSRYLQTLRNSGELLLNLVNDILDFSKIDGEKLELEAMPFSLIDLVEGQSELLAARARQKNLLLTTFIDPSLPGSLKGDSTRLSQILMNLGANAIKFTDRGSVTVSCLHAGTNGSSCRVRFTVQDTGIGISEEQGKRLFKPFTQADSSMARRYGGTGLGLSICKRLLDHMGGEVSFESHLGTGTTFWFELSFEALDITPISETFDNTSKIMPLVHVIEDGLESTGLIKRYIESWKFEVRSRTAAEFSSAKVSPNTSQVVLIAEKTLASMKPLIESIRKTGDVRIIAVTTEVATDGYTALAVARQLMDTSISFPIRQMNLFNAIVDRTTKPSLPIEAPAKVQAPLELEKASPAAEGVFEDASVLVAEDNPTNQLITTTLLKRMGLRCQAVINGREAVAAWETGAFDLILMDCQMPEMDGYDATIAIRKLESSTPGRKRTPILALTANVFEADRDRCFQSGMDAFISKPVRRQHLAENLKKYLKLKDSPQATAQDFDFSKVNILVADDDEAHQLVFKAMFTKLGCAFTAVATGKAAVDVSDRENFDLILMDRHMPELDGVEATRLIREREKHKGGHVQIVAISATSQPSDRQLFLDAGMDEVIAKPIRIDDLRKTIQTRLVQTAEAKGKSTAA